MVILTDRFIDELDKIADYIAFDSQWRAAEFVKGAKAACAGLDFMPYKFRKSLKFDDENVRDFVFKGYVLPYRVETLGNSDFRGENLGGVLKSGALKGSALKSGGKGDGADNAAANVYVLGIYKENAWEKG